MDLLTFALYHEQQQQSFTKRDLPTSPKPKKRPRVSISDDDEASQASVDDDVVSSTDAAAAKVLEHLDSEGLLAVDEIDATLLESLVRAKSATVTPIPSHNIMKLWILHSALLRT